MKNQLMLLVLGVTCCVSVGINVWWWYRDYEGRRVIHILDGDTFTIRQGIRVRLLGADAPEYNACLGQESKEALAKLILGKVVRLENEKWDNWGRKMAFVRADGVFVDAEMIRLGMAMAEYPDREVNETLKQVQMTARTSGRGVFGTSCNQKENYENADCNIKGNFDKTKWTKKYYLPECPHYNTVKVNLAAGDKWFCNKKEASAAGFVIAEDCI